MQPHSMCALALANFIWNSSKKIERMNGCSMAVEYKTSDGRTRTMKYELSGFSRSSDDLEFKVTIVRAGGGLSCTMTVRRKSKSEGAVVEMTHSTQHVAGLREEFQLWKHDIKSGRHFNSLKYRNFSGESKYPEKVSLYCDLVWNKSTITVPYKLEVTSISYRFKEEEQELANAA